MKKINKKVLVLIIMLIVISIILTINFFVQKFNKNLNNGNNIVSKNIQEIEEYILNISSFEAKIEVTVESNKNTNKYIIEQRYISPNTENQIVLEPANIAGLETIYSDGTLKLNNTKLDLQTVYEEYKYVTYNNLWLNSFIKEYKESNEKNIKENEANFVMTVNTENDVKSLYIDKSTGNPTKLLVQDKNQKNAIYILYNEIKINTLNK